MRKKTKNTRDLSMSLIPLIREHHCMSAVIIYDVNGKWVIYINSTDISFVPFLHTVPLESLHVQCGNMKIYLLKINIPLIRALSNHQIYASYFSFLSSDFKATYLFIRRILKYYAISKIRWIQKSLSRIGKDFCN